MVEKSGDHHLRLVVHPIIYDVFFVLMFGMSEPSTVGILTIVYEIIPI